MENNIENLKTFYQRDLNNLSRVFIRFIDIKKVLKIFFKQEIGILRCEFDLIYEKKRNEKINLQINAERFKFYGKENKIE